MGALQKQGEFGKAFFEKELQALLALLEKNCADFSEKDRQEREKKIIEAFWFGFKAHQGQLRKSGKPFFTHAIEVAKILAEFGFKCDSIAAALLHDTIEDAEVSPEEIKEKFGKKVCYLVEGVTKLGELALKSKEIGFAGDLHKIFLAATEDIRVLIIKICDNLHNMRTIQYLAPEARKKYALKTLDVYAPLARKLSLDDVAYELEDTAFKYIEPEKYAALEKKLEGKRKHKSERIAKVIEVLKKDFAEHGIKAEFKIGKKTVCSIYNKMLATDKTIDEIKDAAMLIILFDSLSDVYLALGRIHQNFAPKPRKIKDYIATPRENFYQALHTTIMDPQGSTMKVYLRTKEMENIREKGVIALFFEKSLKNPETINKTREWLKDLSKLYDDLPSGRDFLQTLKKDYLSERMRVFSTDGMIVNLPKGSTPLDFAYAFGAGFGQKCEKAKVNERLVPLWHELQPGDKVEIIYAKTPQVDKSWLEFVKSPRNVEKIKKFLAESKEKKAKVQAANLRVTVVDQPGVLFKLTQVIYGAKLNIASIYASSNEFPATANFTLYYSSQKQLEDVVEQMKSLEEVKAIKYRLI